MATPRKVIPLSGASTGDRRAGVAQVISNLQVLRGLAALSVVIYHTDFRPFGSHNDFFGVAIFFVISGFIMTHITREGARGFMIARLTRIVPLYWAITLFTVLWLSSGLNNPAMYPVIGDWIVNSPMHIFHFTKAMLGNMSSAHILQSLFFVPSAGYPIVGVGWTLNIEMFFYLLFWGALAINVRFAPAFVAIALYGLSYTREACGAICAAYGHDYVLFFVAGIVCFYAWQVVDSLPLPVRQALAPLALIVLIAWPLICLFAELNHTIHRWLPPLVVSALLVLHSAGFCASARPILLLGDASYALYLTHPIVVAFLQALAHVWPWMNPGTNLAGLALAVAASCAVAVAVHRWIEKPLILGARRLAGWHANRARATAPAGTRMLRSDSALGSRIEQRPASE
jgi:exopolysaccharide production protein ExoZ